MVTYPHPQNGYMSGTVPDSKEDAPISSGKQLKIFSLSSEYPNPTEPVKGLFVRARLQAMALLAEIRLAAPIALLDYANPYGRLLGFREIPPSRTDGSIQVLHPRWIYPPYGGVLNAFCMFLRLLPVVRKLKQKGECDVIDAHFAHPEGIAAALLGTTLNIPFVITMRGSEFLHAKYILRRHWMSWAMKRATLVIAVSDELRALGVELGADPANTALVTNGINSEIFNLRDRAASRQKLAIPEGTRIVLAAGNLAPIKCHEKIVRALRGVIDSGIDAQLWLAGGTGRSGRHEAVIREEIAACGLEEKVRFVGEVPQHELAELMSVADVFCLASSREGCPNVVNEAMACGTPVVSTDVGAVRRLIPSPEYGIVVPRNNPAALQKGIAEALQREWNAPAIAGWAGSRSWAHVSAEAVREISTHVRSRMACRIIVNADDFGMSESVNHKICDALGKGKLCSVTILANSPLFKQAVQAVRHFPKCSFGVHLNLTEFEPLTGGARSRLLVDKSGQMSRHIAGAHPTPTLMEAMYDEWCAQISRLISSGVQVTHIDSHNHIHTVPYVFPALKRVQKQFGIRRVRITKNIYGDDQPCTPGLALKKRWYNVALRNVYATRTTEGFSEMSTFYRIARQIRPAYRTVELMVHPGAPDNEAETELLYSDWNQELQMPVDLINYEQL